MSKKKQTNACYEVGLIRSQFGYKSSQWNERVTSGQQLHHQNNSGLHDYN